ncbi:alanine racemase [Nocardia sp. 852002-20019_SCH5090214]|uniref:amino acid deaminase/aldolase n=1 Tax=Nocardia TaxID=1817 RepID=UPI0007A4E624|nr:MULTISPECIES: amino acid deaminase/aldolase [Nocardia]OBF86607.1 alanine racemase [Mycobacterium sp. 852002-51759_SCH5129042]MBF6275495.1 amino acid deaminase/aldolase [Nocardia nova]OBA50795.1 alanine racemase [Nocardia sp. 852002-20019_SCH5090214]OBA56382.1 alanine racemase [Nocardia sp. 852002-51101_SCH5132738]OBB54509.1 alanine racemase [Nocardia sp. 852002-51244_SCH5132740]
MTDASPIADLHAATADLDPPLAALDLSALRANAADLVRRARGVPIRVASKSVRCRAVLEEVLGSQLTGHGGFAGIMSYSLREALWLAGHGARDILLGYPSVDRAALAELAADATLLDSITLMIDDVAQLDLIRAAVGGAGISPRVCLDVDASLRIGPLHLGVRRSPIRTPEQAERLARVARERGFRVVGVMTYEAQIAGLPDTNPAVRLVKRLSAAEIGTRRTHVLDAVRSVAGELEIVNSGGSGSIEVSVAAPEVTEVTAGSGLYVPTLFDGYRAFTPRPALYFALPVLRRPAAEIATVFAGGYIASGPAGASRVPKPVWPKGLRLIGTEGAGEVQTPFTGAADLAVGDRVWMRHAKAGELCERFDAIHIVDADDRRTTVPTYRGEGRNFG